MKDLREKARIVIYKPPGAPPDRVPTPVK